MITVQSYFNSFFAIRRGLSSCILPRFVLRCFLFRGMVRNWILRICIYFGSTERNSELCSLPQKGSEQNYGSLLLFLFHGTEFGVGTEFRDFLFRGTTGNSVGKNHLFRLFRLPRNYFFVGNSQPYSLVTTSTSGLIHYSLVTTSYLWGIAEFWRIASY